jgi:hypothetical protein
MTFDLPFVSKRYSEEKKFLFDKKDGNEFNFHFYGN